MTDDVLIKFVVGIVVSSIVGIIVFYVKKYDAKIEKPSWL